ncbi:cytochrome c family oxidase subunit transmembrane domain protein [Cystoisospora suis]|uniref:Cytochrome c family oxidase subunit transmembrane domain protein n=1 Tax=Cystoisospora suis TaxID=483139 RepID=A0A2C6KIU5_9APIC|nr:cytochrome c family oxidase subunit transmembrane domain protein [Cystoisospora suis]
MISAKKKGMNNFSRWVPLFVCFTPLPFPGRIFWPASSLRCLPYMAQGPHANVPGAKPGMSPVGSVFSSFFSRRSARPSGSSNNLSNANVSPALTLARRRNGTPARNDHPENWRIFMGGHDPATPMAEGLINMHNHHVMWMIFVVCSVMWPMKCRI